MIEMMNAELIGTHPASRKIDVWLEDKLKKLQEVHETSWQ